MRRFSVKYGSFMPQMWGRIAVPKVSMARIAISGLFALATLSSAGAWAAELPIKKMRFLDPTTFKPVTVKDATLTVHSLSVTDRYFPSIKEKFGKIALNLILVQPGVGHLDRQVPTVAPTAKLPGRTVFVVSGPARCTVDAIRKPPFSEPKKWNAAQRIDADYVWYQRLARDCSKTKDANLKLILAMFQARALAIACLKGDLLTCPDALEVYGQLSSSLKSGKVSKADFKRNRLSTTLISQRVEAILRKAAREGFRTYSANRAAADRKAASAFFVHIDKHALVTPSVRREVRRYRTVVLRDMCRAGDGQACTRRARLVCEVKPQDCAKKVQTASGDRSGSAATPNAGTPSAKTPTGTARPTVRRTTKPRRKTRKRKTSPSSGFGPTAN